MRVSRCEGARDPSNANRQNDRTRKSHSLKTVSDARHTYSQKRQRAAYVIVINVLGCDTNITVAVKVKGEVSGARKFRGLHRRVGG